MQVSPVDIQAWASDTGAAYPSTPSEKAAVLPAVAAWKAEQLADAKASRGQNAISPLAVGAGAAGLGLAGLIAFNHFRKQGLSEPAAAAMAKQAEQQPAATTAQAPQTNLRLQEYENQAIRNRVPARSGTVYDGPRLRADSKKGRDRQAAELVTRGGRNMGAALAREQGQYKARTDQGFHNPEIAALDTPLKRELYLASVAEANGADSPAFNNARSLIASLETSTPAGVDPTSFLGNLSPESRFGTTTAEEQSTAGKALGQSRTKANTSAQAGFRSRETAPQRQALTYKYGGGQLRALLEAAAAAGPGDMGATFLGTPDFDDVSRNRGRPTGIDAKRASVFFQDSDGTLAPYLGNTPVFGPRKSVLYSGRRKDGSPIAESDLAYFPTDDASFYERTGLRHPALTLDDIRANDDARTQQRFASDEDQSIKGMLEALPASDPRFATGTRVDGVGDNWTMAALGRGTTPVPIDLSGFQSEMESPAIFAGGRLRSAISDHRARSGTEVPESVAIQWATSLAKDHGTDPASVLRVALGVTPRPPQPRQRTAVHALGAGSGDALDRVYNALGTHAGADAWELDGMVRSGDIKGAAAALASQLPALTSVNSSPLRGMGQDEKLNIVAEGVTAGLSDLAVTLEKYPQAAEKFGIGKGPGGFGIDAYLKSYVRDWVAIRALQLDPTGQPTYQVPNDAFEILAHQAHRAGHSTLTEIQNHVRGAANGLEGALKIDRLVSSAQSTKQGDPNTNATSFAQTVFDLRDPDLLSTRLAQEAAGDVKLSFSTRRNYDATAGFYDRNPTESQLTDAIGDYATLADGTDVSYGPNAILAARVSGSDNLTPEGKQRQAEAREAQKWITAHAEQLERERADLNRGILQVDGTPRSIGRGIVLASDQRGAFLAGDTQGINTPIREEVVNDLDTTPLDVAQDNEREARLNNQIAEPDGIDATDDRALVPVTEADTTARQYGATKLHFKNLGPNSRGAMAPGEAFYPRQQLRRYLQERGQDETVGRILDSYLGSSWQAPDLSVPGSYLNTDGTYSSRDTNLIDLDPYQRGGGRAAQGDEWRDPRHYGVTPTLNRDPRWFAEGFTAGGASSEETAAMQLATAEAQELTGGRHRTIAWDPEGRPFAVDRPESMVQGPRRPPASFATGGAIDPYASYGAKGITSDPRPQITDFDQLSELVSAAPRSLAAPEGNTETAARHRAALEARAASGDQSFRDDQQLRDASDRSLLDRGEVSGLGRRGSTFPQAPITAAPISSVPAAAIEQLNTLSASLGRPVQATSDQERGDARARHLMSYIESAATPQFDKRGRQVRGWTGGDSWHGGAHLAGRADRNVGAYVPPSDAMVDRLVATARSRRGI